MKANRVKQWSHQVIMFDKPKNLKHNSWQRSEEGGEVKCSRDRLESKGRMGRIFVPLTIYESCLRMFCLLILTLQEMQVANSLIRVITGRKCSVLGKQGVLGMMYYYFHVK